MSVDVKSLVRSWLRASPSARNVKFSPPLSSSFSPRPERLGLGATPPQGVLSSEYDKQLEKRVRRKIVGKKIKLDTIAVVTRGETAPSSDEECSRASSVRRPRIAAVGHVVEGGGSGGRRNRRKRRRQQKAVLSSTHLSSDSGNDEGSSPPAKSPRREQGLKMEATPITNHTLGLGSEFRNTRTPPSTQPGNNADVQQTKTSPYPVQDMSTTEAASPTPLPSLKSQHRLRGGSMCEPMTSNDIRRVRRKTTVERHVVTAASDDKTNGEPCECRMMTESDGMLQGNSDGNEEEVKSWNANGQTSPISKKLGSPRRRRRRLKWACVHRGQSLPWSTPPRMFRQRRKCNVRQSRYPH